MAWPIRDVVPGLLSGELHNIGGQFAQGHKVLDGDGQQVCVEELWSGTAGRGHGQAYQQDDDSPYTKATFNMLVIVTGSIPVVSMMTCAAEGGKICGDAGGGD